MSLEELPHERGRADGSRDDAPTCGRCFRSTRPAMPSTLNAIVCDYRLLLASRPLFAGHIILLKKGRRAARAAIACRPILQPLRDRRKGIVAVIGDDSISRAMKLQHRHRARGMAPPRDGVKRS